MFPIRLSALALIPTLTPAVATAQCQWDAVASPNPSDFINTFTFAERGPDALFALLQARDSFSVPSDPHVLRRDGSAWTDLGRPSGDPLGGQPVYFTIQPDDAGGVWIAGVSDDDISLQARPAVAHWDGAWQEPLVIDMVNQLVYPFHDRGGEIYAMDIAPDGTRFAVGAAKGYALTDDGSVPLFLVDSGFGWSEVTQPDTDWPGGFAYNTYLTDVIAFAPDDVWAVGWHADEDGAFGPGGLIVHWDGTALAITEDPRTTGTFISHPLEAMAAFGPDDIWAVGGYVFEPFTSTIAHYDGKAWTRVDSPLPQPLHSLTLRADGTAWAAPVNTGADVATFDGTAWTAAPAPRANVSIAAVAADPGDTLWMLGADTDRRSAALQRDCVCPADVDGDGAVGTSDLLMVLAQWGTCASDCAADANGDGAVDTTDLLAVLGGWGPCA